jgi:hypothetical protein
MAVSAEEVINLFVQLGPQARENARSFILARTPSEYQALMQRLVNASPGFGPASGFSTLDTLEVEGFDGR